MSEDSIKKRKAGRPQKNSSKDVQRSFLVNPDLWDAADSLPIPRPDIIREALANAVSFYASDLQKLRWQLEEVQKEIQSKLAREHAILERIKQLEDALIVVESETVKAEVSKEQAVKETLHLTNVFSKRMTHEHFDIIAGLSGIDSAKIEVFLKDTKYRPSENDVRTFIFG